MRELCWSTVTPPGWHTWARGAKGHVPNMGTSWAAFPALLPSALWELAELCQAGVETVMELAVDIAE